MSLLSIVLPAYNEEQNIANTAKVLGELLEQHGIDYELVFISFYDQCSYLTAFTV